MTGEIGWELADRPNALVSARTTAKSSREAVIVVNPEIAECASARPEVYRERRIAPDVSHGLHNRLCNWERLI